MFVPMYITVHMYVYLSQMNYTAQLQLIKYNRKLSYEHNAKPILTLSIVHMLNSTQQIIKWNVS